MGGKLIASAGIFRINNEGRTADDTASSNPSGVANPTGDCRIADEPRLFSNYRATGTLQGLSFGGGVAVQDHSYMRSGVLTASQGGYSVFNAMAGYEFRNGYSLQVNVNNLGDKVYYKKYGATGLSYYYGDPRNVVVTLRATF